MGTDRTPPGPDGTREKRSVGGDDAFDAGSTGTRRTRWRGLVGFSLVRLWVHAVKTRPRRFFATVGAVSLTIALLVVVTGTALALAGGGVVDDADADARVTPESSGALSTIDGVEPARLGGANDRAAAIDSAAGVDHASPILVEPVELQATETGDAQRVLLVGVAPDDESRTVSGLPTDELETDPGATADGASTVDDPATASRDRVPGGLVLSTTAADRLGVERGDDLAVGDAHLPDGVSAPTASVRAVEETEDGETPVVLVHLDVLQALAGADDGQLADAVLIWGDSDAAATAAEAEYPDATVESNDRPAVASLFGDGLAFATSVLALVVGIAICSSFVATTAAMTVNDDRRMLAVLASVGFPARSRLAVVASSTLLTTLCGAIGGVVLGTVGIRVINAVASATVTSEPVAQFHSVFVPYAVAVAFVAALLAVPYPLAVAARTSVLEEVGR